MMSNLRSVTAIAHPNIALVKYWGNKDNTLRIPAAGSISMNLGDLQTRTKVAISDRDSFKLNDEEQSGSSVERTFQFLRLFRQFTGSTEHIAIESWNDFPTGAGIASSASAFAALASALVALLKLNVDEAEISRLARLGSGSACRSIPDGYVEWHPGQDHSSSYASSIVPADHWDLVDCIAVVESGHKKIGSSEGHALADTSPLQSCRITDTPRRLELCRTAILHQDFSSLAAIAELDSDLMHSVMMTSTPALHYWLPSTLAVMQRVRDLRTNGLPCFYTIDAGPNVHVITHDLNKTQLAEQLRLIPGVTQLISSRVGNGARII